MTFYTPDPFDTSTWKDPLSAQNDTWSDSWDKLNEKKEIKSSSTASTTTSVDLAAVKKNARDAAMANLLLQQQDEAQRKKDYLKTLTRQDQVDPMSTVKVDKGILG